MQHNPAVASDGVGYLVVWGDSREGAGVWASRVDANGALLDETGIIVSHEAGYAYPEVAFDGSNYVVFWGTQAKTPKGVYAARVKPDGSVLDNPPITLSLTGASGRGSRGAAGSLAVWQDWSKGVGTIYARRIAQNGSLLGGSATLVAKSAQEPDVAFDGTTHLVAWHNAGAVLAARLSSTAVLLDATPIVVTSAGGSKPAVAAGASGFAVSWADGGYFGQIRSARVSANGTVLDPTGIPVPGGTNYPDVGFDGASFLTVFMGATADDVFGVRMAPTGKLLDPAPFPISSGFHNQEAPRVASRLGEHLAIWESSPSGTTTDISGRRVSANGALLGTEKLSFALGANDQLSPAVASSGKDFLMVWEDARNPFAPDLYAERITSDGIVLDPVPIPIALASGGQEAVDVTFDGAQYLVVWQDRRGGGLDIYGARVQLDGTVIDSGGFPIASSTQSEAFPAVASNGSGSFVVWSHGGGFEPDLHGARVAPSGAILDPTGFVIAQGKGSQSGGTVETDGTNFFVVWTHDTTPPLAKGGSSELRAALYAADGSALTPTPVVVSAAPGNRYFPRVAFGNGVYLVVWHDERNAIANDFNWDIYAARVTPSGVVLDPGGIRVTTAPGEDLWPDVTWSGSVFVVGWNAAGDKRAARVDASGTVMDPDGFVFSPTTGWAASVSVAANGQGKTLVGYQHYDDAREFRAPRARARTITFVEETDAGASDASFDTSPPPEAAPDSPNLDSSTVSDVTDAEPPKDGSGATSPGQMVARGGCGCEAPHTGPPGRSWIALALAALGLIATARRVVPA